MPNVNNLHARLMERVSSGNAVVGVLGLGYVGLPLAVAFAKASLTVLGFDINSNKVEDVNAARNYIKDIADKDFKAVIESRKLSATTDLSRISQCDAVIICVPTPLDEFRRPDMSYIQQAAGAIGRAIKPGTFVSLESTTYPTTTEDLVLPIIEKESGLKGGSDFWICFSPERVDPGNKLYHTENTPKIIGCLSAEGREIALALYGKAIKTLLPVSSPRAAEMVKILENTYRLVNISLVNELALLCGKMSIDIWEVIEAAKSKPYGFQAFYPGPGIGGHCIPLDPVYLEHVAKRYSFEMGMIHAAGQIDALMPHRMVVKIASALNHQKKPIRGSRLLFLGVAYKRDIDDPRESPALKIMDEVARKGGVVSFNDPYVARIRTRHTGALESVELTGDALAAADCVVIATDHTCYDPDLISGRSKLVVDLRNLIKKRLPHIYRL